MTTTITTQPADIAKRAETLVSEKLNDFAWKRGKSGGSSAQKEYADACMRNALAGEAVYYAVFKGWDAADARVDTLIKRIDRNSANAIDTLKGTLGWTHTPEDVAKDRIARAERTGKPVMA
jgi:hypothetical protein